METHLVAIVAAAAAALEDAARPLTKKELQRRTRARLRETLPPSMVSTKVAFGRVFREALESSASRGTLRPEGSKYVALTGWPSGILVSERDHGRTAWFTEACSPVEAKHRLLEVVRTLDPFNVERLVAEVLRAHYPRWEVLPSPKGADGGVDVLVRRPDPRQPGFEEIVCVQVKRFANAIGRPQIETFRGALRTWRARHANASKFSGLFVTTGRFAKDVREHVERDNAAGDGVVVWSGDDLVKRMLAHAIGVQYCLDPRFFETLGYGPVVSDGDAHGDQ